MSLENQCVVVLGGSSGVGLSVAQLVASLGAKVIVTGRDQEKLQTAVSQIGRASTSRSR